MNKKTLSAVLAVLLFAGGCASGGPKRPTVFVDQHNIIPADIPTQFDSRYERFISDKEMKAFHKLQTDEERQAFTDKFWAERDPDPATPENEEKQRIDQLIEDIADERFFNAMGELLFRSNGGFRGDMAHVYLLHGEPNAMDMVKGNRFVNLMLWVYADQRNGSILYAFLFYQRGNMGAFQLFSQDAYQLDPCGAVNEIRTLGEFSGRMGVCAPDTYEILNELQTASGKAGVLDGYIFAWALFNFSQDGSIRQGEALEPPKPASEVARLSGARVAGEAPRPEGTAGTDFILASCKECKSFMPAELGFGERFSIFSPWKNFDWIVKGEDLELSIKYRIVLQERNDRVPRPAKARSGDHSAPKPIVLEGVKVMSGEKSFLEESPEATLIVDLLEPEEVAAIPAGTYWVSVYVKNTLTGKYNAWVKEFIKKAI